MSDAAYGAAPGLVRWDDEGVTANSAHVWALGSDDLVQLVVLERDSGTWHRHQLTTSGGSVVDGDPDGITHIPGTLQTWAVGDDQTGGETTFAALQREH